MKKFIVFVCFLSLWALSVKAQESYCSEADAAKLKQLEDELNSCGIRESETGDWQDMREAHYEFHNCCIAVVHKIFDEYYKINGLKAKENFDSLVKSIYNINRDIEQNSDIGSKYHFATIYDLTALGGVSQYIKNVAYDYLNNMKIECDEFGKDNPIWQEDF